MNVIYHLVKSSSTLTLVRIDGVPPNSDTTTNSSIGSNSTPSLADKYPIKFSQELRTDRYTNRLYRSR